MSDEAVMTATKDPANPLRYTKVVSHVYLPLPTYVKVKDRAAKQKMAISRWLRWACERELRRKLPEL